MVFIFSAYKRKHEHKKLNILEDSGRLGSDSVSLGKFLRRFESTCHHL
jgi:hypothetical protein